MSIKIPVTEVCIIFLKDPYQLKDPSTPEGAIWAKSIETLKRCEGFRDIYTSLVVGDPKQARMFINWDCVESHFFFYDTPHFPAFRTDLVSLCAMDPFPIHAVFDPAHPKTPFEAPTTAIYMAYFPLDVGPTERRGWEAAWATFLGRVAPEAQRAGMVGECCGWVNEAVTPKAILPVQEPGPKRAWMATLGWESVRAHECFREAAVYKEAFAELESQSLIEVYHLEF